MRPFDLFISHISWGSGGKLRPVILYAINAKFVVIYPITTQYKNKSKNIKSKYFRIDDWAKAGLHKQSYVDTGEKLKQSLSTLEGVITIGRLTKNDKQRFLKFLSNEE
jgi:hypothetical protein